MVGNSHLQSKYFKELTLQNKINYPLVNRKFQFPKIRWRSLSKSNKLKNTFSYFIKKIILEEASKSYLFFQSSSKIIVLNLSTRLCFVQSSQYVPKLTSRKPVSYSYISLLHKASMISNREGTPWISWQATGTAFTALLFYSNQYENMIESSFNLQWNSEEPSFHKQHRSTSSS